MRRLISAIVLAVILSQFGGITRAWADHIYLCRSPLLAYDFWNSLIALQQQRIVLTPTIAAQVCNGMKAGRDPQCIRVERTHFEPFASGWNGALAMTDGSTKIWFHMPDGFGWIDSRSYISWLNAQHR
ncbi:MAG TPA: hypothetical protein VGG99_30030 [Acetobacteraceae bacterium]|jgi:hypothetical protein